MAFRRLRIICTFGLAATLLVGATATHLAAQTATATILGTVTDASGSAVPDATVRVINTGTNATQVTASDSEGRYRVPALPVGDYEVRGEKAGFETEIRRGITLTVGADLVVDFSLQVGQVTQSVTVEGQVSQVETTSTAVSNVVEPTQMRELPLNGRSFEQLILLSPGVTIHQAIGYTAQNGFGNAYSVSGSRTRGQWELLDDNDVMNWQDRGSGSGVLGTQLGVDAIAEFQVLTNTYSAQYGGNGAAIVSVTRSGTNNYHGSVYEFIRNSAMDARNFFDPPQKPLLQKNQFGGTIGGPIKKDKMFFFVNYEGIRQSIGVDYPFFLPDQAGLNGFVPDYSGPYNVAGNPNNYKCANNTGILWSGGAGQSACYSTIPTQIQTLLKYFPPQGGYPYVVDNGNNGLPNGIITAQETAQQPGREDYIMSRYDWTISDKDSAFARYLYDGGHNFEPFIGGTLSPAAPNAQASNDRSLNQYLSVEEKHIWSANLINTSRFGFTRTLTAAASAQGYSDFTWGQPDLWSSFPSSLYPSGPQGSISILNMVNPNITRSILGGATAFRNIQNKFSGGEDVYWNRGAHSFQFGMSAMRVQSYGLSLPTPGAWTFANMQGFLTLAPVSGSALCNPVDFASACGTSLPQLNTVTHFGETDFGFYAQDNWKVSSRITVNLGLRYSPSTNPKPVGQIWEFANLYGSASYNPNQPMPGCTGASSTTCPFTSNVPAGTNPLTKVNQVFLTNSSLHNFEPRVGIAWDPFGDHKTSVRAGYGIFRSPVTPYDYTSGLSGGFIATPYLTSTTSPCGPNSNPNPAARCNTFPLPTFSAATSVAFPLLSPAGIDPGNRSTPYIQQYNLIVQRQIAKNTTISVGYIGSHSVHLIGLVDENPSLPDGVLGAIVVPNSKTLFANSGVASQLVTATCPTNVPAGNTCWVSATGAPVVDAATGQQVYSNLTCPNSTPGTGCSVTSNNRPDPLLDIASVRRTTFWARYNSLQAGLVRRMSNNLSGQISYTWASCQSNSSGTTGFENGLAQTNPWNANSDSGNCAFLIRHDLSVNGLYELPFKRNRLVSGWQLSSVFAYHTGSPISMSTGWASGIVTARGGPIPARVNLVPGCNQVLGHVNQWFNNSCFTQPPIGEDGNIPMFSAFGPDYLNLDTSLVKNTQFKERYGLQFRAEFFNVLNRVNFRNPGQPMAFVFASATPLTSACASDVSKCSSPLSTLGQLFLTNGNSRQIQFGMKFTF